MFAGDIEILGIAKDKIIQYLDKANQWPVRWDLPLILGTCQQLADAKIIPRITTQTSGQIGTKETSEGSRNIDNCGL